MSLEIRQSNIVIFSNAATLPSGIKLSPGEKLLATWYVPTDNVGSQITGYATIIPDISAAGDQVTLFVKPLQESPPQNSNPMRVLVFAMVDVPLIKVGAGRLFSDAALTKPETSLVNNDHAFLGVPVTNTSDVLTVKSVSLSLDFDDQAFALAGVFMTPAPPGQVTVENIGPGSTALAKVTVNTGKEIALNKDLELRLKVANIELGIADQSVSKNFAIELQKIHLGA